jgi:uncharacterized membrane protein
MSMSRVSTLLCGVLYLTVLAFLLPAAAQAQTCQPDLQIRSLGETAYSGDNLYIDDFGQHRNQTALVGKAAVVYEVKIENDGDAEDTFTITGTEVPAGWSVCYLDAENTDRTAAVTGGTAELTLAAGASSVWRVEVAARAGASGTFLNIMSGISKANANRHDEVFMFTFPQSTAQPDLQVHTRAETLFIGDNIFSTDGANQQKTQDTVYGTAAIYYVAVQNDGPDGIMMLRAPATPKGWTAYYYDTSTWTVITPQITSTAGWPVMLKAGETRQLYVALLPIDATITAGSSWPLTISANGSTDPATTVRDAVQLITCVQGKPKFDLQLRAFSSSTYSGDNVYSADGANQSSRMDVNTNGTASYMILLQNDGNLASPVTLKAPAAPAGWKVTYLYCTTTTTDITAQMTSAGGWTSSTSVAMGSQTAFIVTVSPDITMPIGSTLPVVLSAMPAGTTTVHDAVQMVTGAVPMYQTDLLLRTKAETANSGDNVYSTDATIQTKRQTVDTGAFAAYYVTVQNDGKAADTYNVRLMSAPPKGWKVQFYNAATWESLPTPYGGWLTTSIAGGTSLPLYIAVSPDATAAYGTDCVLNVTATSRSDLSRVDTVSLVTSVTARRQADLQVRTSAETVNAGDNVYSADGATQIKRQDTIAGGNATYPILLQNDGNAADTFTVKAAAPPAAWQVSYMAFTTTGYTDVTTQVTSPTGWTSGSLAMGASTQLLAVVCPNATQPTGAVLTVPITATPSGNTTGSDTIQLTTTVSLRYAVDLLVRTKAETAYAGDNVYATDYVSQTKHQDVAVGTYAAYYVTIQNDGKVDDSYNVRLTSSPPRGWKVQCYNALTWEAIPAPYGGWLTGTIAAGASLPLYFAISPDATAVYGTDCTLNIRAVSLTDNSRIDTVSLVSSVTRWRQADLQVRALAETSVYGDNLYSADGANQLRRQEATSGGYCLYQVYMQNDGNQPDAFILKAPAAPAGWKVTYNRLGTTGYVEITDQITGTDGWTSSTLAPGVQETVLIAVYPELTLPQGSVLPLMLTAVPVNSTTGNDAVQMLSTAMAQYMTDVLVRTKAETTYSGDNVYGSNGANQTKTLEVTNGVYAAYYVAVQNDGKSADSFLVRMTAPPKGWKVQVYNANTWAEITSQLYGGYLTDILATGAQLPLYIAVQPDGTVEGGTTCALTFTATSRADARRIDAVTLSTSVTLKRQIDMLVRLQSESAYTGNNVYGDLAAQHKAITMTSGGSAVYYAAVQNDGNASEAFVLTAGAAPSGWKVTYYDGLTWNDISAQITSPKGWTSSVLAPNSIHPVYVAVMPMSAVVGALCQITITGAAVLDTAKTDAVQLLTSLPARMAVDLLVHTGAETMYSGDGIYSINYPTQQKTQTVAAGQQAVYYVMVQNDGNLTDSITVTAPAAPAGWVVTCNNTANWENITPSLTSTNGVTFTVAPGGSVLLYVIVKTASSTTTTPCTLTFTAVSGNNPAQQDAVQLTTSVTP